VNCEYVLFVTVENLDKGKKEKRALVEEILKNLKDAKVENGSLDCFSKFLSCCKYGLLQKIYVPLQIYFYTKSCGDDVMFYDPIIYQDEKKETKKGAEMLHFRFLISIQKDKRTATHMIKDIVDICNLKLLTVSDNKIIPYKEQIPELRLIKEV